MVSVLDKTKRCKQAALFVSTRNSLLLVIFSILFSFTGLTQAEVIQGDPEIGKRIYLEGLTNEGKPITAIIQGDIKVSGTQFKCQACHRRSGYGSSEGGTFVLPITSKNIYEPRTSDRAKVFKEMFQEYQPKKFWSKIRTPNARPAYDVEALGKLLSEGIDPSGRMMEEVMPRFEMSDQDVAHLAAYLKQLSARPDPGVDDKFINFATIVTGDLDSPDNKGMIDVLEAFFKWRTIETQRWRKQPGGKSKYYKALFVHSLREWNLNIWHLKGDPNTWPQQLNDYYRKQPVFAVIGGNSKDTWWPVHSFCETKTVPCVFPTTDAPVEDEDNLYNMYFHGGLSAEARILANYLKEDKNSSRYIKQIVFTGDKNSIEPAEVLNKELVGAGFKIHKVAVKTLDRVKEALSVAEEKDRLVIWSGAKSKEVAELLKTVKTKASGVYLPGEIADILKEGEKPAIADRLFFSYLYAVPADYQPRAYRIRGWMNARGVKVTNTRLQYNTYYAASVVMHSLRHMIDDFSRDYMVELIEHEAENALNTGTFPALSLGPGQRFASKGGYVIKLSDLRSANIEAITAWIIPE